MRRDGEKSLFDRFLVWRQYHIGERQFVLLLSLAVGTLTAFAALLLKSFIHFIGGTLTKGIEAYGATWLYLVFPVIGILLSGLFITFIVKDDIGHGITKVLYSLSKNNGRIKPHNMFTSVIASGITIGFGGSVGAEAPIVLTGSAIGSNIGRLFRMEHKILMLLIGCGAAGAIAGIFKAPIAGIVFVLEVLMIDLSMSSLLPLLVSSVTATVISYIFTGTDAMFQFMSMNAFSLSRIPYVLILGIVCGLLSLYFSETTFKLETFFRRMGSQKIRFVTGAVMLSVLIFLFPPLFGEGYETIEMILNSGGTDPSLTGSSMFNTLFGDGNRVVIYLTLIVMMKVFASTATNAGGGCGGIFAPSLFLGCLAGCVFGMVLNSLFPHINVPVGNFALFGMAGVMAGVMHAPLTGIFLIAELTGGYSLFLPLMMVSISSYLTIRVFQPHSLYSMRLAQKGELLTHHKDQSVLLLMKTENVIEKDFIPVTPDMDLGQLIGVVSRAKRNLFPVLDKDSRLVGVVNLDSIRNIMFRQELYHRFYVERFMETPPARLLETDPMETVMKKFDDTGAWNLPVEKEDGRYVGFVSKSKIFNSYRNVLLEFSDE